MFYNLIEVTMADSSKLYIESADRMPPGNEDPVLVPAASMGNPIRRTAEQLKESFTHIKDFSDSIATSIQSSAFCPQEFELEFGVKFAADAGIVISSLSSEANIKIRMKWTK